MPQSKEAKKWMTAKEVAEEFYDGMLSADSIRRKAHDGTIPFHQIRKGGKMLFERACLKKLIKPRKYGVMPSFC